jgi:hypothetical protein
MEEGKEKKMRKTIMTLAVLVGMGVAQEYDRVFDGRRNEPYRIGIMTEDNNKDGKLDTVVGFYDFNKNGKPDVEARYLITKVVNDSTYDTDARAYAVMLDNDEDGTCDEIYLDKDGNGTLETKLVANKEREIRT